MWFYEEMPLSENMFTSVFPLLAYNHFICFRITPDHFVVVHISLYTKFRWTKISDSMGTLLVTNVLLNNKYYLLHLIFIFNFIFGQRWMKWGIVKDSQWPMISKYRGMNLELLSIYLLTIAVICIGDGFVIIFLSCFKGRKYIIPN